MHLVTLPAQDKAFFAILKQQTQLDGRDTRGRKHSLALVLMGVLMALCSGRDGNLSSLHRHMKNRFGALCRLVGQKAPNVISRAQLPRLLAQVNQPVFAQLVLTHYGLVLGDDCSDWLSGDGKELRGSILKGKHRGEVCVSVMAQTDNSIVTQTYYNGTKESERPAMSNLLISNGLVNRKMVLDALHLTPALLETIHQHKGSYLIGLKDNQHHLLRLCIVRTMFVAPCYVRVEAPKRGHGRIEERTYACFPIGGLQTDSRWHKAGLTTLLRVQRIRCTLAGVELSRTDSFFVTNEQVETNQQAELIYDAIRGHWGIETMHYRRDVVFAEDACRSRISGLQRIMSSIRTLALNLLHSLKPKNMAAQLDEFADNFQYLFEFLKLKRVL